MNQTYLWAAYGAVNLAVLLLYLRDKIAARRRGRRTSEAALLAAALVGPFGAFLAMQLFRHKTRKPRFLLVPLSLLAHAVLIACLLGLAPVQG